MIAPKTAAPPSKSEAIALLADTARAVKVMKASWLHVALNLQRIREHELWRHTSPPSPGYDHYVVEVLQLNRYVAQRMLHAMLYTDARRPDLVRDFAAGKGDLDVPSLETVDQLRRVERAFEGREGDFRALEDRVFEDGIGRVVLKREIAARLDEAGPTKAAPEPVTLDGVLRGLLEIEKQLLQLKVSKQSQKLVFQLIEALENEKKRAAPGGAKGPAAVS